MGALKSTPLFRGQEGLQKVRTAAAKNAPYAVAFVDVRMPPGWDGIETITRIWAEFPDLQIVICTAFLRLLLGPDCERRGQQ